MAGAGAIAGAIARNVERPAGALRGRACVRRTPHECTCTVGRWRGSKGERMAPQGEGCEALRCVSTATGTGDVLCCPCGRMTKYTCSLVR